MKLWLLIMALAVLVAVTVAYLFSVTDCRRDQVRVGGILFGERCK